MLGTSNVDFGFACCADIGLAWTCYYLCFIEVKWIIATASFFRCTVIALKSTGVANERSNHQQNYHRPDRHVLHLFCVQTNRGI